MICYWDVFFLHSSNRKSEETGEKKPDGPSAVSNIPASDEPTSECNPTKAKPVKRTEIPAFPEPLVPYPRFSTLNIKNRKMYLNMLVRKNYFKASKVNISRPDRLLYYWGRFDSCASSCFSFQSVWWSRWRTRWRSLWNTCKMFLEHVLMGTAICLQAAAATLRCYIFCYSNVYTKIIVFNYIDFN